MEVEECKKRIYADLGLLYKLDRASFKNTCVAIGIAPAMMDAYVASKSGDEAGVARAVLLAAPALIASHFLEKPNPD